MEYRSQTTLADCPDAPHRVEARLEQLESILHVQGPPKIVYSRFTNWRDATAACSPMPTTDCTVGPYILSEEHALLHEVVHATMSASWPNAMLMEGLAVAYGYQADVTWLGPWPDWSELIDASPSKDVRVYNYGGAFVAYLITTYGVDDLVALYRLSQTGESPSDFARRFGQLYPVSIDDAWHAAAATAQSTSICTGLQPNMQLDGSEAGAPGDHCIGSPVYARHAFALDQDTSLGIETGYQYVTFGSCNGAEVAATALSGGGLTNSAQGDTLILHLAPWQSGTYYATPTVLRDNETFRIRAGNWIAGACELVTPYLLYRPVQGIVVMMRGGLDSWAAISWAGTTPLVLQTVLPTPTPYRWSICATCDEADCTPVNVSPPYSTLTLMPGTTWIHAAQPAGTTGATDYLTIH